MVRVITQEVEIEESLKKRIEFICSFCNTTPIIENGSLRTIERTNLAYLKDNKLKKKEKGKNRDYSAYEKLKFNEKAEKLKQELNELREDVSELKDNKQKIKWKL